MTESMRERIARAILDQGCCFKGAARLRMADAVLAAMEEPTGAMVAAGEDQVMEYDLEFGLGARTTTFNTWRAMIRTAREGK